MKLSTLKRFVVAVLAGIIFFQGFCFSSGEKAPDYTFMNEATKAPKVSYYDYIIVGGGTAGCPLAATLSQRFNVLLLERGGSPYGNPNVTNLDNFGYSLLDQSPQSPAQQFISQDGVVNSRARVLGGGTAINAGFYSHAEEQFVEDSGWDKKLVQESYQWVEKAIVFEPNVTQWQSSLIDGLLESGVVPYNGFTFDHLIGTKVGGTIFDRNGKRHTAADLLNFGNPNRLTVVLHAHVRQILFKKIKGAPSRPRAHGVLFVDESGVEHRAYLSTGSKNEVILSAGALGSPQLLMLSGIGPKEQLQNHSISVVIDQPLVGQGMADNPTNVVFVPSPIPIQLSLVDFVGITHYGSYIEAISNIELFGPNIANYGGFSPLRAGLIVEKVKGPLSKGFLELQNSNPDDNPLVTFNYFKNPKDLQTCVDGIRTILRVIKSKAFSRFRYDNISLSTLLNITAHAPQIRPVTDDTIKSLDRYCIDTVRTIWHYHGGCQVNSVIDDEYKVLGVDGLRVIDGSTFSSSPGTNPQATLLMLGRYMGLKMLQERV